MKTFRTLLILIPGLTAALSAAPLTFDFTDPKGVNNAVFELDAPLEAISGSASGISGTVTYDPENVAATKGKIVVTAASLHVPNPMMKEHLHGGQWMDVIQHPEITFEVSELKNVVPSGTTATAIAAGKFTVKGVTRDLTVPVRLSYLKDKLGARVANQKGDLLVIRATFSIKRSDFGINPKAPEDKVADEVKLTLSIAGAAPRP
jgi:polyisoprenoid-binding protein YceI